MKKEWLLLAGSVMLTLLVALGLIRWLAPHLVGVAVPVDRRVVQATEKVPPFFEVALALAPQGVGTQLVNDPYVGHRRVGMVAENLVSNAPFDLLGFRNRSVPVVADVVAIGDSQTMGMNAVVDLTWPSQLEASLADGEVSVYNVSAGGWGAIQYLYMFDKVARFSPRLAVVAFYTGNDPVDSVHMVYNFDAWADMRKLPEMPEGAPSAWPPKPEDVWQVNFDDGISTGFTAKSRLAVNHRDYPRTHEGYRIMAAAATRIDALAVARGIQVLYTIIPTKELAYAAKVKRAGLSIPNAYGQLVEHERQNVRELATALDGLPHGHYVDVIGPLQQAALQPLSLYPTSDDGHPVARGYQVIADALSPYVKRLLPAPPADGIAVLNDPKRPGESLVYLLRDGGVYLFTSRQALLDNGWDWQPGRFRRVTLRDLAAYHNRGVIGVVDPSRYGPR